MIFFFAESTVTDNTKNGIKVDGVIAPMSTEKLSKKSLKMVQNEVQSHTAPKTPVKLLDTKIETKLMDLAPEIEEFENMGYISGDDGYAIQQAIQPPAPIITEAASEEELEPVSNPAPLAANMQQQNLVSQSAVTLETNTVLGDTKPSISDEKTNTVSESVLINQDSNEVVGKFSFEIFLYQNTVH